MKRTIFVAIFLALYFPMFGQFIPLQYYGPEPDWTNTPYSVKRVVSISEDLNRIAFITARNCATYEKLMNRQVEIVFAYICLDVMLAYTVNFDTQDVAIYILFKDKAALDRYNRDEKLYIGRWGLEFK